MDSKVTEIFLNRLLDTIQESGMLPWERPFSQLYAFNYFSMHEYTGINRWLLPPGEYVTANQINQYNKQTGKALRFKKGIKWYPVFFIKDFETEISFEDLPAELKDKASGKDGYIGCLNFYYYYQRQGKIYRCKKVRRYYNVADISWFEDADGFQLPSRVANNEIALTFTQPQKIIDSYINRENINVTNSPDGAYYIPDLDTINIPDLSRFVSETRYYSTYFHEISHSTGADGRLSRIGVSVSKHKEIPKDTRRYTYSVEECIAELSCALLCREAGIQAEPVSDDVYKNHVAYIQSWMKYFKSNKDDIIWTMSCAEKAYQYVLNGSQSSQDTGSTPIK